MECAGVNVERLTFEAADVAGSPLDDRPQVAAQVDRWVRIARLDRRARPFARLSAQAGASQAVIRVERCWAGRSRGSRCR